MIMMGILFLLMIESSSRVWDGQESSVTIYNNNFTYEMFQWFHDRLKESRYTKNVAFYLSVV